MGENRRLIMIMIGVGALLMVPLIAMQFTNEVNWTLSDFVVMGVLLSGTGLVIELVLRRFKKTEHRILICGIVLFGLFLVWAELAVGIFGTPFAGS